MLAVSALSGAWSGPRRSADRPAAPDARRPPPATSTPVDRLLASAGRRSGTAAASGPGAPPRGGWSDGARAPARARPGRPARGGTTGPVSRRISWSPRVGSCTTQSAATRSLTSGVTRSPPRPTTSTGSSLAPQRLENERRRSSAGGTAPRAAAVRRPLGRTSARRSTRRDGGLLLGGLEPGHLDRADTGAGPGRGAAATCSVASGAATTLAASRIERVVAPARRERQHVGRRRHRRELDGKRSSVVALAPRQP